MAEKSKPNEPIVHSVWIDCPSDDAFHLFTERFAEWWPLEAHSINKDDAEHCAIEPWVGGRIFERTVDGDEEEWGSVTRWEPPGRLEFTWHPGRPEDPIETIEIDFQVEADGTRVTLTHRGWDRSSEMHCSMRTLAWSSILNIFSGVVKQSLISC